MSQNCAQSFSELSSNGNRQARTKHARQTAVAGVGTPTPVFLQRALHARFGRCLEKLHVWV
jgi:hypothetical protein